MAPQEPTNREIYDLLLGLTEGQKDLIGRVTNLESVQQSLEHRFDGLEQKVDGLEQRFDGLEQRFDGLEQKVEDLQETVEKNHEELLVHKDWSTSHIVNMDDERAVGAHQTVRLERKVEDHDKRLTALEKGKNL